MRNRHVPRLRRYIAAALIGALAIVALGACRQGAEQASSLAPTPIVTPVTSNRPVYEVKRGAVVQTIRGSGRVVSEQQAELSFPISARLRRLYVQSGQQVNEGDLLAELDTADLTAQLDRQSIQVGIAELRLAQAIETNDTATALAEVTAALAKAQANYRKAVADLEVVQTGPTPVQISEAEQAVARAQGALIQAQSAHDRLVQGPSEADVRDAEIAVEQQQYALLAAQATRDAACARDPGGACRVEQARVGAAEDALTQARLRLEEVRAGPKPEEITIAQQKVEAAQAGLRAAEAALAELRAGPDPTDVLAAEKRVESTRSVLESAQAAYDRQVAQSAGGESFAVQLARKDVELARLKLQTIEEQIAGSILKAPFAGVVQQTSGREGDVIQAFTTVVVLANPTAFQIVFDVAPTDLAKVVPGQEATIVLSAFPTEQFAGTVVRVPTLMASAASNGGTDNVNRTARIAFVDKPPSTLELGALANVAIVVQKKENVLIVPNAVIRSQGGRRFVRLAEEGRRLPEVDVEIGIADEVNTEIVRGLSEGQFVIQP